MITKGDKIVFSIIILLTIAAFLLLRERKEASASPEAKTAKTGKKEKKKAEQRAHDDRVTIVQKWDMPAVLQEISGIAAIDSNRFACVQDELGEIFIFNTGTRKIEKRIPFAGSGDYEGIAVADATAYVLRADGHLFEVRSYNGPKPAVVQHRTYLTAKQDVEGLCFDKRNNRLLLAIKGKETDNEDYKGIYAFDLSSKKLAAAPVYKVGAEEADSGKGKGKNKIQPSDLEVHPATGDIYIVDGPDAKLIVLGTDGSAKQQYELSNADCAQPEGISFTPAGELFISNEGRDGAGNILKLSLSPTAD